jgi:hypothetical protein
MDYDVSAVALTVPPALASLTTYRPAMQVRNNGRYPATVTGSLSAYKAGLRVYHSPIQSAAIAPGETGNATALDDWTPDTQDDYIWFGYCTSYRDQVEPNNNLAPVTIHVGPEPPTPPPSVPEHHEQHETGGRDVVSIDGLKGHAADQQDALPHVASHQAAGSDQLNVSGLAGVLGEPQLPADHGNEHHTTDYATSDELDNHAGANSAHTAAINLANREISGAQTGLLKQNQLQAGTAVPEAGDDPDAMGLRFDRDMGYVNPVHHAAKHEPGGTDEINFPTVPSGLICLWLLATPIPQGWDVVMGIPPPIAGYVWIQY